MATVLDPADALLEQIASLEVARAQAEAAVAARMLQFQDLRRREAEAIADPERRRLTAAYAADELSQVLLQAPRSVQCRLADARRVRNRLPLTWEAFTAGKIDGYRVRLIASALDKLRDNHSVIEPTTASAPMPRPTPRPRSRAGSIGSSPGSSPRPPRPVPRPSTPSAPCGSSTKTTA
ncbi:DUF222 domain-containing protein [Aeromicrobium sp. UC242_57]|uniref:DUF222 domain-containing protein n=1 Tax=Aeromicrobium sp. UC242_57 TaxID=3374624 RepID=UPI0037B60308